MSYSSNLITVRRICVNHGIVPIDHASPIYKKKIINTSSQIKTEIAKRKVLAERPIHTNTPSFTHTLSPFVAGNEKEKMKTEKVAAKEKIITPRSKTSSSGGLTRTTSGKFTDVVKNYWKKAGADPFALLDEGRENIQPKEQSFSSLSKEKRKFETIGPRPHRLIQSSFSLETIDPA